MYKEVSSVINGWWPIRNIDNRFLWCRIAFRNACLKYLKLLPLSLRVFEQLTLYFVVRYCVNLVTIW